jgi:hypothetical protein
MEFKDLWAWLVTMGVPALFLVALQETLKALGFDPASASPRLAAVLLAGLVGLLVGVLQFGAGVVLFPEVTDWEGLIKIVLGWLATAQVAYNIVWKPARPAGWT